jgi:hypothetical protein
MGGDGDRSHGVAGEGGDGGGIDGQWEEPTR